jgi:hypothetical protein
MRKCTGCGIEKKHEDFVKNIRCEDGRTRRCKECTNNRQRAYARNRYANDSEFRKTMVEHSRKFRDENREMVRRNILERHLRHQAKARRFVEAYKETLGCMDCGFTNAKALDMDHRNPKDKYQRLAVMVGNGWSFYTIFLELEKCDVRCANCHRIRHSQEMK